jgi:hypothetical protein
MYLGQSIVMSDVDVVNDGQTEACLMLWAAKLLTHRKDYERKYLRRPPLSPNISHAELMKAKPCDQAEFWFFIEESTRVGTFSWTCSLFGLEPDRVRTKIQPNWRILYERYKPVALETTSKAALQVTPHATSVATKDSAALVY